LKAAETRAAEHLAKLESTTATREQQVQDLQGQAAALLDQVQLLGAEVCALRQQQQEAISSISPPENLDLSRCVPL
jgi:phage shock protein A